MHPQDFTKAKLQEAKDKITSIDAEIAQTTNELNAVRQFSIYPT